MSDVVVYNDGELELKVSVENETVWLNRNQIAEFFDRDVKTIGKHINNVFKEKELEQFSVVANFVTTASDGKTYNSQYKPINIKKFDLSHDRFLLIDDTVYHIRASLKDLGKKWFAFSKMEKETFEMMGMINRC